MAEQFQSLYRRYRPQRFSEVRGQSHVVLGLRNAVRDERVAHAYLFSGPHGTGKTSTARILAKALNCAAPEEGEPCGRCDSCLDISRGASLDVHELDAASNSGVDAMRDLVARAALATPGKWKVYIVDEVHMLSTAASNALLKTLEEPPSHVVFVLATTDPQKVLPTIRSRTQHFEFHLLESSTLATLLNDIATDAHLDLPVDGIEAAVRRAHGSARDALSALDLVAAAGVVDDDDRFVRELVGAIVERDTGLALRTVDAAVVAGFDAARLAGELVDGLRDVFLSAMAPELRRSTSIVSATGGAPAPLLGPARCVRALEVIGTAIVDMREALDPRTTFEVALVRLTHPEVDDGPAALLERLERLERRLQELSMGGGSGPPSSPLGPQGSAPRRPPAGPTNQPAASTNQPAAPTAASSGDPAPESETATRPRGTSMLGASPALGAYLQRQPETGASTGAPAPVMPVASTAPPDREDDTAMPASAAQPNSAMPTRDDLVIAWADHVLASLKPRARAVYNVGRFVAMEDGVAVFALPNSAHVEHAAPLVKDVAEAISRQVGVRIGLRLITEAGDFDGGRDDPSAASDSARDAARAAPTSGDTRGSPSQPAGLSPSQPAGLSPSQPAGLSAAQTAARAVQPAGGTIQPVEPETEDNVADFDDLASGEAAGRHDSLLWAEGRLLEAFPGTEEVP